jgi:hypothetical protein
MFWKCVDLVAFRMYIDEENSCCAVYSIRYVKRNYHPFL